MKKYIQCVPNFSEGRDRSVVQKIVQAMSDSGANVVDFSMDSDHNRSVVTCLGSPEQIVASIFNGAMTACKLIDMNKHHGAHPRIGAVDVVPVVPVQNISREETVEISLRIGEQLGEELGIPVYLYEWSAKQPERVGLEKVRKGAFEALKGIELTGEKEPDFGPSHIHPTAGATAVGARGPLVAYNVNLETSKVETAKIIAKKIRTRRGTPQEMVGVKAIGIYLESRKIAQVSINITQPEKTSIYEVYRFIENEAVQMGTRVLESELIGASRLEYLLDSFCSSIKLPKLSDSRVIDLHLK